MIYKYKNKMAEINNDKEFDLKEIIIKSLFIKKVTYHIL